MARYPETVVGVCRECLDRLVGERPASDATRFRREAAWRRRLLEDGFELLLVNPAHFKQVPGRKTDVADCAWLAQLLEHGLLPSSFVPPAPMRELRDLTRYRKRLTEERTRAAKSAAQGAAGCRHQAFQCGHRHVGD